MNDEQALVALGSRREAVLRRLTDGFAADLLDLETFDARIERAHGATTVAELDALVADLPATTETALAPAGTEAPRALSSVFSSVERRGAWSVPPALKVKSVFGSTVLDFREARFTSTVTELDLRAVLGNIELVVPPHVVVECEGSALLGSFEHGDHPAASPGADHVVLRIVGRAVLGNVEVRTAT